MKKFKQLVGSIFAVALALAIVPVNMGQVKASESPAVGIDVSEWNDTIDWSQASEEVDFAVIRAAEGTTADSEFYNNADGATEYKVPFGVYVYTLAQSAEEAVAEAENVLSMVEDYEMALPIYLDFEDSSLFSLSDDEKLTVVKAFADTVTDAGYEAGLFTYISVYDAYFSENEYYDSLDKWVSDIEVSECPYSGAVSMWQYSWDGAIAGIDGDVNMNYYYGELPEEEHVHTPGTTTHENVVGGVSYDEVVYCTACGEELSRNTVSLEDATLKLYSATLKLENDITVIFKAKISVVDSTYSNVHIVVEQEKENGVIDTSTVEAELSEDGTIYEFPYTGVDAGEVGDGLKATIYAYDANGYLVKGKSISYSAQKYCTTQLAKTDAQLEATGMSTARIAAFRTLLVDLLNYATAAQNYFGYKTDSPVNSVLTEEQSAYASSDSVLDGLVNLTNTKYETITDPTATWKSAGVNLLSKTTVRVKFAYAGDVNDLTLVVKVENGEEFEVTEFEDAGSGQYNAYFDELTAFQFSNALDFKLKEGDTVISNTLRYSVESYASKNLSTASVGPVVSAMMKYGKAAVVYSTTN